MTLHSRFALLVFMLALPARALEPLRRGIVAGTEGAVVFMRPGPGFPAGPGGRFHLGYQFATGVTPEVVFSASSSGEAAGSTARERTLAYGVRWTAGFGRVRPWISAQVGMARVRWPNSAPPPGALPATGTTTGAAFRAAGGVGIELVAGVSLVVGGAYTRTTVKVPALDGSGFYPGSWSELSAGVSFVF